MTVRTGSRRGLSTPRESYAAIIKGFTLTRGLQSNGLHPTGIDDVLECAAGAAVGPGGAAPMPPGVRHRTMGRMPILDVVVPPFDPADEWFD